MEIHPFLTPVLLVPFQRHLSNPLYSGLLVNVAFLTSFLQRHKNTAPSSDSDLSGVDNSSISDDEVGSGDDDDFFRN
jgi:hypothetical protein